MNLKKFAAIAAALMFGLTTSACGAATTEQSRTNVGYEEFSEDTPPMKVRDITGLGTPLEGDAPMTPPAWTEDADPAQFAIDAMLYVRGLMQRVGLRTTTVSYHVLQPGDPIACSSDEGEKSLTGTAKDADYRLALSWCSVPEVIVVLPEVIKSGKFGSATNSGFMFYTKGIMLETSISVEDPNGHANLACLVGQLTAQEVAEGSLTEEQAFTGLHEYYKNTDSEQVSGLESINARALQDLTAAACNS